MGKCIKHKLNGTYSDDSLPKFGEIKFHVTNNDQSNIMPFAFKANEAFDVNIIGSGYMYKGTIANPTDITTSLSQVTDTTGYRLSTGDYIVSITPKYYFNSVVLGGLDINSRLVADVDLNIDDLKYCEFTQFLAVFGWKSSQGTLRTGIRGNLSSYKGSNLVVYGTLITGTLIDLAKIPYSNNSDVYLPSESIGGTFEEYISNLTESNYSKTLILNFYIGGDSNVTLNGIKITFAIKAIINSSGDCELRRSSDNTLLASYTKATDSWIYA